MKRKMIAVLLLVAVCLGVLVVEGVSQPPSSPVPSIPPISSPPSPIDRAMTQPTARPTPNFATVEPRQQEWTFEQLVEALKGVRARQKELQAQETDLLAKMAEKVEEKRRDLSKSEEVLQKLRGEPSIRSVIVSDPLLRKAEEKRIERKDEKK